MFILTICIYNILPKILILTNTFSMLMASMPITNCFIVILGDNINKKRGEYCWKNGEK